MLDALKSVLPCCDNCDEIANYLMNVADQSITKDLADDLGLDPLYIWDKLQALLGMMSTAI